MGDPGHARSGTLLSGAGNRFVLVDAIASGEPADPARLAREWCAREEPALDGLLVLTGSAGSPRMVVYNRDGSRPEACGNGLRCLAHYALAQGYARGPEFSVETDAGACAIRVEDWEIATCLGTPRVEPGLEVGLGLESTPGSERLRVVPVVIGNPHAVVFRAAVCAADVQRIGAALQAVPRFPGGVNVELVVAGDGAELDVRVWERGVGETAACATGAAAVLAAARAERSWGERAVVRMPGGILRASIDARGRVWVAGPVAVGARVEFAARG